MTRREEKQYSDILSVCVFGLPERDISLPSPDIMTLSLQNDCGITGLGVSYS